jgi:hypothetical protein
MKTLLTSFFLTISFSLFAQEQYIFDTAKVTATTKLIGRYPQFDKEKSYKDLNFIIDDPEVIKRVIMTLPLGKEGPNTIADPNFRIIIVQDFKEIKTWIVNPNLNSVLTNGKTFEFDVSRLKRHSKTYPFDYKFEKIVFNNKEDYQSHLEKQKADKTFLFDYAPQFKYEGSFEIQFPRNETFSSPKAISEYLTPLVEKIVSKNEYRITYTLNEKNRNDQTQFTMTITGSKKLYNELQVDNLKKENWSNTIEEGWFFYRTK